MKKYIMLLVVILVVVTAVFGVSLLVSAYQEAEGLFADQGGSSTDQGGSSTDQGGSSTDQGGSSTDQGGSSTDQGGDSTDPVEPSLPAFIEVDGYKYYTTNTLSLIDGVYSGFDKANNGNLSNSFMQVRAEEGVVYFQKGWEPEAGCDVIPHFAKFSVERWTSFAFFYQVWDSNMGTWSDLRMVRGKDIGLWYNNRMSEVVEVRGRVEINPSDDSSGGTYDLYLEIPAGSEVYGNHIRLFCFQS